jgi:peroxiredoxin
MDMVRKNSFFWLRLIFLISIIAYLLGCPSKQEERQQNSGSFDFSLTTLDGEEIRLKDYRGKKMVHLAFWATWCPSCLMEIPKLKKLYYTIGNKPYEILAINVGINDSLKRVKYFQERYQIPYKILFDEKGEVSRMFGIIGIPTNIIIDKEGIIRGRYNQSPEDTKNYLNQLFSHHK